MPNPTSLFSQQAKAVAEKPPQPFSFPAPVLENIENGMREKLIRLVGKMPEEFECQPDASAVIAALEPRMEQHLKMALDGHRAALGAIETSTLNDTQKEKLRQIAATRRLDLVQVAAYKTMASRLSSAAFSIGAALASDDFVTALITLRETVAAMHSLASVMDMSDPRPTFHTAECLIALGRVPDAVDALRMVVRQSEAPNFEALKARAKGLLDLCAASCRTESGST